MEYKVDHFSRTVSSLEQSVNFYKKNFGFQEIKRAGKPNLKINLAKLQLGGSYLELIEPYDKQETKKYLSLEKILAEELQDSSHHLAISVDKLHPSYLQLKENNVEVITSINEGFFFCKDPDGYLIEVKQSR